MQQFLIYIDPGSGSFIIQAIIATILGIAFYFKNIALVIKAFFYKLFKKKRKDQ